MTMIIIKLILIIIVSYIIGSIPTGYLIVKKLKGIDIRKTGSGSTGATNVKRILGTKWFYVVMLIDAIKGAIPVFIAHKWFNFYVCYDLSPVLAAAAAVIGHSKSVFLNFTGGKSVATSIGTIIALNPIIGLIAAAIWGIITYTSKYVSLGSVIALCLVPLLMNFFNQSVYYIIYSAACAVYVIFLHQSNIKRLMSGRENKVRK